MNIIVDDELDILNDPDCGGDWDCGSSDCMDCGGDGDCAEG